MTSSFVIFLGKLSFRTGRSRSSRGRTCIQRSPISSDDFGPQRARSGGDFGLRAFSAELSYVIWNVRIVFFGSKTGSTQRYMFCQLKSQSLMYRSHFTVLSGSVAEPLISRAR